MVIKNQITNLLLILSIFIYGLDAYSIFNIPFSWMGLMGIFTIAVFNNYKILFNSNLYFLIILFLIPSIFNIFPIGLNEMNLTFLLRTVNIVSFFAVLYFSLNYFNTSDNGNFLKLLQKLILVFSIFAIYTYFAQIYDLPEFIRNRSNTGLLGNSLQTTFWQYEPHRAIGSFREPILFSAALLPLYLIYLFTVQKIDGFTVIVTSLAIGLTRSDLVRVYCSVILILLIIHYLKNKNAHKATFPILLILVFSLIGIRECDLNPLSQDCLNSNISSTEIEVVVFNDIEETLEIGRERSDVIDYVMFSFSRLTPQGITNVNSGFSSYLSQEITNEMYLTNRSLPEYLLTRYEAKNFGTGNYSLLRYAPNVQNLFVNTLLSLGVSFIALLFLFVIHLWFSEKKDLNFYIFVLICIFFFVIPIEELNAFSALIMGVGYNMIVRDKGIYK